MVVRVYLKQAWNLMKQNPLFSTLYIVGTGISIVMTMVIAIVYYVRLAPVLSGDEQDAYIGGEIR